MDLISKAAEPQAKNVGHLKTDIGGIKDKRLKIKDKREKAARSPISHSTVNSITNKKYKIKNK